MPQNSILVAVTGAQKAAWVEQFQRYAGTRSLHVWPEEVGDVADIAYACVWNLPHGTLRAFPNLKVIFNLGAGADYLLADPALPDVPIVRAVHPDLSTRMTEYVVLHVLMHHRKQRLYDEQQRQRLWRGHEQPAATEVAVGVMGLGEIGRNAASMLSALGFQVAGWSRTSKSLPGIETFCGEGGLDVFLARTEILVCVLPLTEGTRELLNLSLFRKLKRDGALGGAYLINAGRGGIQVDADILQALEEGTLAGATLDVFPTEPLAPDSPFWTHPRVTITPHNAGDVSPAALVDTIMAQIARFEAGGALRNVIDRARGY